MGCNVNIYLPTDIRGRDAALVVGILAGLKAKREPFERGEGTHVDVDGASERGSSVEGMSDLVFKAAQGATLVDKESQHSCTFHYGGRHNGKIFNLLYPTSTPFWCAVALELVEWFGGIVEYNDCGSGKKNTVRRSRFCPTDRFGLIPDDGKSWERYNDELMKIKPVTSLALKRAVKVAAYGHDFEADGITLKRETEVVS